MLNADVALEIGGGIAESISGVRYYYLLVGATVVSTGTYLPTITACALVSIVGRVTLEVCKYLVIKFIYDPAAYFLRHVDI